MRRLQRQIAIGTLLLAATTSFAAEQRGPQSRPPVRMFYSLQWQDRSRTNSQIYAMKPDGSGQVCLTPTSDTDYRPAISPDGRTIAFTTHRDGIRAIYLMNPDGSNQRRLTNEGDAGLCAWSPDGKQLAFSSNRNGRYCIYVMNADGTNIRRITEGPSEDFPAWSPDNHKIAFEGRQNNVWRIYVVNADGRRQQQITTEKWDSRWPQWSPDGKLIAYTSYEHGNGDIYTMRPDGTQTTRLTDSPSEDQQPAWAGTSLLFHTNRTGHFDVFSIDLNSRAEHRLTAEKKDTADIAAIVSAPARRLTRIRRK